MGGVVEGSRTYWAPPVMALPVAWRILLKEDLVDSSWSIVETKLLDVEDCDSWIAVRYERR